MECAARRIVTSREFLDPSAANLGRDVRFGELDKNRDGQVTPSEWAGDAEAFRLLDQNRDGALSLPEYESTWALSRRFRQLDYDGSGDLSPDEWPGDRMHFARLDRDRNGVASSRATHSDEYDKKSELY